MTAQLIPPDFTPDIRIYRLCEEKGIPEEFMLGEVSEFILYWQEKKKRKTNWQSTFWNCVKMKWSWKCEADRKNKTRCTVKFNDMPVIEVSKKRPGGRSLAQMIADKG